MKLRPLAIAAAVLGVGALVALLAGSEPAADRSLNFEVVGEVAPQIVGTTLDGERFDLAERRGQFMVVNFFASWCVGCRVEHPELVKFAERHRSGDAGIVAVMFSDDEESARQFFTELGGDWPALVSDTGQIAIDYGVTSVPETLLISPAGRVVQKWIGASGVTADGIDAAMAAFS